MVKSVASMKDLEDGRVAQIRGENAEKPSYEMADERDINAANALVELANRKPEEVKAQALVPPEQLRKVKIEKGKEQEAMNAKAPEGPAQKKQKSVEEGEIQVLDSLTSTEVPSKGAAEQGGTKAGALEPSGAIPSQPTPLQIEYPSNPVRDSPPFIPQILIPSPEFPNGRPFTIKDSAFDHPEEYLKGVLPPWDVQNTRKSKMEDIHSTLMQNVISISVFTLELIARSQTLHTKAGNDDAYIKVMREKIREMEKEEKKLRKSCEALEEEKKKLKEENKSQEQQINSALAQAEASKVRAENLDKLLTKKDEVLEKIGKLAKVELDLSSSGAEYEKLSRDFEGSRVEQSLLRKEIENLKVNLITKTRALEEKDSILKEVEAKAKAEVEAQIEDCVEQMRDAHNEFFLEGWEAAMKRNSVEITNPNYRDVPYPDSYRPIPPFSFERPPQTPSIQAYEEDIEEGEVEVESSLKDTTA